MFFWPTIIVDTKAAGLRFGGTRRGDTRNPQTVGDWSIYFNSAPVHNRKLDQMADGN